MARNIVLLGAAAALTGAVANAQQPSGIELFGRGGYAGPSMNVSSAREHIEPAFTVKSVRIVGDGSWELCSGNTYTGCRRVDRSTAGAVFIVRSVRPVAPVIVTRVSPANRSLRGVASEFFVAPQRGSSRVTVATDNGEQMRRAADEFCRSAGWQISAHAQVQQDGATYALVDVLCINRP